MYPTTRIFYHCGTIYKEFWGIFIYMSNYEKNAEKLALKIIQKAMKNTQFS